MQSNSNSAWHKVDVGERKQWLPGSEGERVENNNVNKPQKVGPCCKRNHRATRDL